MSTAWAQKGLLFYEHDNSSSTSRVWLWSDNPGSPKLILEVNSIVDFFLSPNGQKIAWHDNKENTFTIYNLLSQEYADYPWLETWEYISKWDKGGKIVIIESYHKTYLQGVTSDIVYFDDTTQQIENKKLVLNLPGYTQDDLSHDPQDGFAILDPTKSLIIYSSNENHLGNLIILDLETQQKIWRDTAQWPYYPHPDWTIDGDFVAFIKYFHDNTILHILSRDGKSTKTIDITPPNKVIRELKWSSDKKNIYYSTWMTINDGPAYIIDLDTNDNKEVCSNERKFLNGYWVGDKQFAYIVLDDSQSSQFGIGELWILDIDSWNYSTIFRTTNPIVSPFDLVVLGEVPILDQ